MSNYSRTAFFNPVREWFSYHFKEKKLNTWLGYFILGLMGIGLAYLNSEVDFKVSFGFTGFFAAILIVILFLRYPYFGMYFLIAYSAFPITLLRFTSNESIPFNTLTDLLIYLTMISVLSKPEYRARVDKAFWNNPVMHTFIILLIFYLVQGANPNMLSKLGWLSFLRRYISILMFFYFSYALLHSWSRMKYFIHFSLVFTSLLAAYACKQQWFGLAGFEMNYITRAKGQLELLIQGGLLRKFSTLSDPATSGILFSSVAVQCILLFLREKSRKARIWLMMGIVLNLLAYGYSGTRTATLMIVAGFAFYSVATLYEKRTLVFISVILVAFTILMTMPFSPPSIGRIRSTFMGTKDASANVRDVNRHRIQPYLYAHPMGGGIFTCINEGLKYNPGHYLATFPPDSGYMKIFAEQGWIGLLVNLITYGMIMWFGLKNFYSIRNPEIQNHCIALLTVIFMLWVGQISQMAMGLEPQVYYYLAALVLFIKIPNYDKNATPHDFS